MLLRFLVGPGQNLSLTPLDQAFDCHLSTGNAFFNDKLAVSAISAGIVNCPRQVSGFCDAADAAASPVYGWFQNQRVSKQGGCCGDRVRRVGPVEGWLRKACLLPRFAHESLVQATESDVRRQVGKA